MTLYPAAALFILAWLMLTIRNADNGVRIAIAVIPFGMFAAVVAGGLSILLSNLLAIMTIGVLLLRRFGQTHGASPVTLPPASVYLLIYAAYGLFSAVVMVRLFQGQFLVFPMSVTFKGIMTSAYFPSTMVPLRPSNSNISQSFYILLSAMFFLATVLVARRRGIGFIESGLVWAAWLNIALGAMDMVGLDGFLELIRTADYALNNEHTLGGVARVIGGYAEAAAFGAVAAAFFAYFGMSFLIGNRFRDGVLALFNLGFALLAVSSTAVAAIGCAFAFAALNIHVVLRSGMSRQFGHLLIIVAAIVIALGCLVFMLTPAPQFIAKMLDSLVFNKGTSLSGLERAAWAKGGIDTFLSTWGLGAGPGSLRANGLIAVILGSMGVVGMITFGMFIYHGIIRPLPPCDPEIARPFYAGRVAAATLLVSMAVSATVPDPTLILTVFVSVSVIAREQALALINAPMTGRAVPQL